MLKTLVKFLNTLQKTIDHSKDIPTRDLPKLCYENLKNKIKFGIYSETTKGYITIFKSTELTLLKDVLLEEEITKNIRKVDNFYFVDLYIFYRASHKKVVIRLVFENLEDDEIDIINEIINNFHTFQELKDNNVILVELINILKETSESENINYVIEKSIKITKKILGTQGASILLKDEKSNELYFKVIDSEKSDKIKEIRIPIDKGIAGYTARTGIPLIVNDVSKFPEFYSNVDEKSGFITRSVLSAPIKPLGKIIGVIEAVNKIKGTNFNNRDLEILKTIGDIIGINIINSLLYQRLNNLSTNIIKSLISALEARDEYTKGHSLRVQIFSSKIARAMGLTPKEIKEIELSAILHDIGKIGIPDNILRKPDKLTNEEFEIIKKHPVIGYNILSSIEGLENILDGIKYHHERFDGKGYPDGLKGKDIPLIARIIAVADTLDAMTSDRPYRKGLPIEYALEEIKKCKNSQLDPEVVDAFLSSFTKPEELKIIL